MDSAAAISPDQGSLPPGEPLPEVPCSPAPVADRNGGLIAADGGSVTDAGSVVMPPDGAEFAAFGETPMVAAGPDGSAIVSWSEQSTLWVRRYLNGHWAAPELIAQLGYEPLIVGAGRGGRAVAVYYEKKASLIAICARVFAPDVGWSEVTSIGTATPGWWQDPATPVPRVGLDDAGNALVAWDTNVGWSGGTEDIIAVRRYSPTTGWGPLSQFNSMQPEYGPVLAMAPQGGALMEWSIPWTTPPSDPSVLGVAFDPNTGWGQPEVLATAGRQPALASEADGQILAAWGRRPLSSTDVTIETARLDTSGAWTPPTSLGISSSITPTAEAFTAFLDVQSGAPGYAAIAWSDTYLVSPCPDHGYVSLHDPNLGWSPQQEMLGTSSEPVQLSAVGVNLTGETLVLLHDAPGCGSQQTLARWYRPSDGWHPATLLDVSTDYENLAMASDGRALIVGSSGSVSKGDNIIAARWLAPP